IGSNAPLPTGVASPTALRPTPTRFACTSVVPCRCPRRSGVRRTRLRRPTRMVRRPPPHPLVGRRPHQPRRAPMPPPPHPRPRRRTPTTKVTRRPRAVTVGASGGKQRRDGVGVLLGRTEHRVQQPGALQV